MSQPSKSVPSAVLHPNRNHDLKVPFCPDSVKSSRNEVTWRHSQPLSSTTSSCSSPLTPEANDENLNPNKAPQPVSVVSALQMETPGKGLNEICNLFAALKLYTPNAGDNSKNERAKPSKTKLSFSETFDETNRVCEQLTPANDESYFQTSGMTLIIPDDDDDDDDEYVIDAEEYLQIEENQLGSKNISGEGLPDRRQTIVLENTESCLVEMWKTGEVEKSNFNETKSMNMSTTKLKEKSENPSQFVDGHVTNALIPKSEIKDTETLLQQADKESDVTKIFKDPLDSMQSDETI